LFSVPIFDLFDYKRRSSPTAGVTGKGGTWREKPPDAESAVWGRFPMVWVKARTCPEHAVLGRFCKTLLNFVLVLQTLFNHFFVWFLAP